MSTQPCARGHYAYAVPGREGHWFWACRNCPMVRDQGQTEWRLP